MSEMVERVARALCVARGQDQNAPSGFRHGDAKQNPVTFAEAAEPEAIAVIAAMREPTEAMVVALLRDKFLDDTEHNRDSITLDWQVMIKAARSHDRR